MKQPEEITIEIERVLELSGIRDRRFGASPSFFAYVSKPQNMNGQTGQYAFISYIGGQGWLALKTIDPKTGILENINPDEDDDVAPAIYSRAKNGVINSLRVNQKHLQFVKTLEDVLGIPGVKVIEEKIPSNKYRK